MTLLSPNGDPPAQARTSSTPKTPTATPHAPEAAAVNLIRTLVRMSWKTKKTLSGKLSINVLKLHKDLLTAMLEQDPLSYFITKDGHTKITNNNYPVLERHSP